VDRTKDDVVETSRNIEPAENWDRVDLDGLRLGWEPGAWTGGRALAVLSMLGLDLIWDRSGKEGSMVG